MRWKTCKKQTITTHVYVFLDVFGYIFGNLFYSFHDNELIFFVKPSLNPCPQSCCFGFLIVDFEDQKLEPWSSKAHLWKIVFCPYFFFSDVFSKIGNNTIVRFIDTIRLQKKRIPYLQNCKTSSKIGMEVWDKFKALWVVYDKRYQSTNWTNLLPESFSIIYKKYD